MAFDSIVPITAVHHIDSGSFHFGRMLPISAVKMARWPRISAFRQDTADFWAIQVKAAINTLTSLGTGGFRVFGASVLGIAVAAHRAGVACPGGDRKALRM
ncbi:hypothetical protein [Nocardia lijiangensis]|uniref:hypothetical protein n=1 Tax=Nocardia lijiangensis TaxID=299618 RepID=UPI0012DE3560|nr:hypothetical protein [Nocardia lijiangensis]